MNYKKRINMKPIKYLFIYFLVALLAASCEDYLDPINPGSPPGPDVEDPELEITFPVAGKPVVSPDVVATVTFKFLATDDVEIKSITIDLDGTVLSTMTSFKDYMRADVKYVYDNLTEGDHTLTVTVTDKTDKTVTGSVDFKKITAPVYVPMNGEVMYLPLDGYFLDLISGNAVTVEGTPGFATGKVSDAYAGAADAYMTYPTTGILGSEFSVAFWYKINAEPVRGGILAISPEGDSRSVGLRMFRENSGALQNVGLNFGIGTTEVWMNPFVQLATDADWTHIAISISTSHATCYVNGEVALEQDIEAKIDWTGCPSMSIASGAPNFTYWDHYSDLSLYDEIHIFNRAITAEDVQSLFAVK
jgi:hypothetical protein